MTQVVSHDFADGDDAEDFGAYYPEDIAGYGSRGWCLYTYTCTCAHARIHVRMRTCACMQVRLSRLVPCRVLHLRPLLRDADLAERDADLADLAERWWERRAFGGGAAVGTLCLTLTLTLPYPNPNPNTPLVEVPPLALFA